VANPYDLNSQIEVEDFIDHAVVADTNAISALSSMKLSNARRVWADTKGFDSGYDARNDLPVKALEFSDCGRFPFNPVGSHQP
jgi:hypothetical protein